MIAATRRVRAGATRRHTTFGLAGLLVAGLTLGACTSPRDSLGTSDSRCFAALPAAKQAVNSRGRFSGVRYVTSAELERSVHALRHRPSGVLVGLGPRRTGVCLVAYTGHFAGRQLQHDWPTRTATGRLALVVVRASDDRVLATVVLDRLPLRFSHVSLLIGH